MDCLSLTTTVNGDGSQISHSEHPRIGPGSRVFIISKFLQENLW